MKKHIVRLSVEERTQLTKMANSGRGPARTFTRARILLKADQSDQGPAWADEQISQALDVTIQTVERVRRQLVEDGLEAVLSRRDFRLKTPRRKIDGNFEASIAALEELREATPTYSDSIALEIELVYLNASLEGDHLDAIGTGLEAEVKTLWNLMDSKQDQGTIRTPDKTLPTQYALHSPYPNPFNSTILLGYELPEATMVDFGIYDLSGRLVASLIEKRQEAGVYHLQWNGSGQATGIYFVRLRADQRIETQRILLIK